MYLSQRYIPNNVTLKIRNRLHFMTGASLRLGTGKKKKKKMAAFSWFTEQCFLQSLRAKRVKGEQFFLYRQQICIKICFSTVSLTSSSKVVEE